jgi:hypothetical protein
MEILYILGRWIIKLEPPPEIGAPCAKCKMWPLNIFFKKSIEFRYFLPTFASLPPSPSAILAPLSPLHRYQLLLCLDLYYMAFINIIFWNFSRWNLNLYFIITVVSTVTNINSCGVSLPSAPFCD